MKTSPAFFLSSIRFKNFRSFEDVKFEFNPLTVLTGPNNSGKSSVAKGLLLLQANLENPNSRLGKLIFDEESHKLGSFESVLNNQAQEKKITFELVFENASQIKKDRSHILGRVQKIRIVLEYEKDIMYPQNGILTKYIFLVEKKIDWIKVIEVEKRDRKSFQWQVNGSWIVNSILENNLFEFSPMLYKIWDKIDSSYVMKEIERQQEKLKIESEIELRKVENIDWRKDNIDGYREINEKLLEIIQKLLNVKSDVSEKEIDSYNKKLREKEKEIDEIKVKLNELYLIKNEYDEDWNISQQIRSLEKKLDQAHFDLDEFEKCNPVYKERERLNKEKEYLESRLVELVDREIEGIKRNFYDKYKEISAGKIRSKLYDQIKNASKHLLENIGTDWMGSVQVKKESTIIDFLILKKWSVEIKSLLEKYASKSVKDLIEWTEDTVFVKDYFEKNGIELKFYEIIGENDENQLLVLLLTEVSELVQTSLTSLAFRYIGNNRGIQRRVYKSSRAEHHLEEVLAKLLLIKYNNVAKSNDFVQEWARKFGIVTEDEEFEVEVVDGDFLRGVVINNRTGSVINIADKGLGVIQLLPIIIYIADMLGERKMLFIEEPGVNLHPALHAKLVDLIRAGIDEGVQFLIETHSEYFLRNLQYQVCQRLFPSDYVLIRYINPISKDNLKIAINEEGDLFNIETNEIVDSFGDGFLGQAEKWNEERKVSKKLMKETFSEKFVMEALTKGEGNKLEFKASMFEPMPNKKQLRDIKRQEDVINSPETSEKEKKEARSRKQEIIKGVKEIKESTLVFSVMKTLAAFANTEGGVLIIGIAEDSDGKPYICGIEKDLKRKEGVDNYKQQFDNLLEKYIGNFFVSLMSSDIVKVGGKDVFVIKVKESKKRSVYLKKEESGMKQGGGYFYVRREASTVLLNGEELEKYTKEKWK